MQSNDIDIAVLKTQIADSREDISTTQQMIVNVSSKLDEKFKTLNTKLDNQFVSKVEFFPVKNIVYGMVGLILTGLLTFTLGQVLIKAFF
jgi:tetrahydromethanopterin S-methyltransferase subunit B